MKDPNLQLIRLRLKRESVQYLAELRDEKGFKNLGQAINYIVQFHQDAFSTLL